MIFKAFLILISICNDCFKRLLINTNIFKNAKESYFMKIRKT